jgi:glycosyltransferase involved in cell wall biosynthesis
MIERIVLVHGDRGRDVDGIRDYSQRLAEALRQQSVVAEIRFQQVGGEGGVAPSLGVWPELRKLGPSSAIVLQYSPFCFARWGFAPLLPAWLLAIRARRARPALAVMVHEPYVPMESWRWMLMGLWQRLQLTAIRQAADVVFTSIERWAERFEAGLPRRPVHHLPVGSNLPDARDRRSEERDRLGLDEETVAISTLGRDHPSWLADYVVASANAVAASGQRLVLLSLGAEAPLLRGLDPTIAVHAPGYLAAERLAGMLAASDLFLAPLIDGVSTRRGGLMAALQHGLPVLGTEGPLTDSILRKSEAALRLTEVGDRGHFASSAVQLAGSAAARASSGAAARQLYESNFDWPVIAQRLLAALPDS